MVALRYLALSTVLFTTLAIAQSRGPIPASPLTPSEIADEERAYSQLLREEGLTEEEIAEEIELLRDISADAYTFRDVDVRAFFPEISEADQQAYSCFIQLTSPQNHTFAYLSDVDTAERTVRVKALNCGLDSQGLYCELNESDAFFHDSPQEFFFIDESIDAEEARLVISMYEEKRGDLGDLNSISKRDGNYVLGFGRSGCACRGETAARIRGVLFWKWIEVSDEQLMTCI